MLGFINGATSMAANAAISTVSWAGDRLGTKVDRQDENGSIHSSQSLEDTLSASFDLKLEEDFSSSDEATLSACTTISSPPSSPAQTAPSPPATSTKTFSTALVDSPVKKDDEGDLIGKLAEVHFGCSKLPLRAQRRIHEYLSAIFLETDSGIHSAEDHTTTCPPMGLASNTNDRELDHFLNLLMLWEWLARTNKLVVESFGESMVLSETLSEEIRAQLNYNHSGFRIRWTSNGSLRNKKGDTGDKFHVKFQLLVHDPKNTVTGYCIVDRDCKNAVFLRMKCSNDPRENYQHQYSWKDLDASNLVVAPDLKDNRDTPSYPPTSSFNYAATSAKPSPPPVVLFRPQAKGGADSRVVEGLMWNKLAEMIYLSGIKSRPKAIRLRSWYDKGFRRANGPVHSSMTDDIVESLDLPPGAKLIWKWRRYGSFKFREVELRQWSVGLMGDYREDVDIVVKYPDGRKDGELEAFVYSHEGRDANVRMEVFWPPYYEGIESQVFEAGIGEDGLAIE